MPVVVVDVNTWTLGGLIPAMVTRIKQSLMYEIHFYGGSSEVVL